MIDWTAIGSVATAFAGLVVAWQAHETRKTAEETRNTAKAAADGLQIARDSLAVNRDLALEAIKNRLDTRAPRLKVSAAPTSSERARHRTSVLHTGEAGQEWPRDREFQRSEDDHQPLTLGAQFELENEGADSLDVWVDGPVNWLRPLGQNVTFTPSRVTVKLAPRERCEFRLEATRPLHEWADAWENRSKENDEVAGASGEVICSDSFDDGVIDRWRLDTWCYPVEPKLGDLAGWVLRPHAIGEDPEPPVVSAHVGRLRRDYYFSKEEDKVIKFSAGSAEQ